MRENLENSTNRVGGGGRLCPGLAYGFLERQRPRKAAVECGGKYGPGGRGAWAALGPS